MKIVLITAACGCALSIPPTSAQTIDIADQRNRAVHGRATLVVQSVSGPANGLAMRLHETF